MTALIHMVSVPQFEALTPDQRLGFMADIAAEWIDAGENGEFAMPDSYSRLFERRVHQMAKLNEMDDETAMQAIIDTATSLAETGDFAFAHTLGDEDEQAVALPEVSVKPAAKPRVRRPAAPKATVEPEPEATEPEATVEPEVIEVTAEQEIETPVEAPSPEVEVETPSLDPADAPADAEPETIEPTEVADSITITEQVAPDELLDAVAAAIQDMVEPETHQPEHHVDELAARRAAAEAAS